ncbi:hypothetical protein PN462_23120 [Spirulina sp. CS-785/01]|uniref:ArnT family glycosyltransferase n=1 Tax=Spirulina sp. CS-785/01 TaxID=3021716 RepID=UPI00232BF10E|nr:hypothetical protein [Spirulina sp. CS-785/01]MDB9316021.1 hypothetical protein [Spirulina sp. CS-785/01]
MPITEVFQFDTDEGINLIKAILYNQGFQLYQEIWTDQPPLFTVILAFFLKNGQNCVIIARLLVLGFATLLVWTFTQLLRQTVGEIYAVIGAVLLVISINFLRFSVSVMIGLPSVALALLSVYFLFCFYKHKKTYFTTLSGLALAASLQVKMFTLFLVPLIAFYWLTVGKISKTRSLLWWPFFQWLANLGLGYLLISLLLNALQFEQFFNFHVQDNLQDKFVNEHSLQDVIALYLQGIDTVFLSIAGLGLIRYKLQPAKMSQKLLQFPLVWLVLVTVLLVNHKPIWYHHYLLLSIPLTWLATAGIKVAVRQYEKQQIRLQWRQRNWGKIIPRKMAAIALLFTLLVTPIKLSLIHLQNQQFIQQSTVHWQILETVKQHQANTHWLFTDLPIYGVYADLKIPPEIATFSRKRVAAGKVTPDFIFSVVEKYQPEQYILSRFPSVKAPLNPYLQANFTKIHDQEQIQHYVQK